MCKNKKKYRRLSRKRQVVEFSTVAPSSCRDLYFYSDRYTRDFERNGEVFIKYKISTENNICLSHHRVFGQFVFPTDAYLEMLVVACRTYFNIDAIVFDNIVIVNPLMGNDASTNDLTIVFQKEGDGLRFTVRSKVDTESGGGSDKIHIRGSLHPVRKQDNAAAKYSTDVAIKKAVEFSIDQFYSKDAHIFLGEFYRSLKSLAFGKKQSIGKIEVDIEDNRFLLHPSVVSAALANAMSYGPYQLSSIHDVGNDLFLPYKISGLSVFGKTTGKYFTSLAEVKGFDENWIELYLEILNENDNVVLSIETLRLQRVKPDSYQALNERPLASRKSAVTTSSRVITEGDSDADIAVIGMSCRFPMSQNIEEFWDVLKNGSDCITEVPEGRWQEFDRWYNPDPDNPHTSYSKWGGFIDDVDKFDPLFFNISPSEAELMDPQQRIFLEQAWRTIESAGYSPSALNTKKCGVFVGCTTGDYDRLLALSHEDTNGQTFMGTSSAILAARIAYLLNLKGPSLSVDTACSSSLTAVHLACMSIRNGESDLAIAGGISIFSTPIAHILTSRVRMQSMDGRCFTFDKSANGTVFSEGCGIVMLKPLAQAEQDKDNIIGVIKGSGINQDGKTNGITAPSAKSQESLLSSIYQKYKINPADITYVEAHGTATPLGDPIEFQALTNAFQHTARKNQYCAMGSVKSNIGHGSYTAGVAGLIKTLLCLKHNKYVPTAHFKEANTIIDLERSPFFVSTNYEHWAEPECGKRVAAVSSFGFSGANAHMVLEEYKAGHSSRNNVSYESNSVCQNSTLAIVPLSAKNKARLSEMVVNLSAYLKAGISDDSSDMPTLSEIAYTLQTGRDSMDERVVFVVHSVSDLLKKLDEYAGNNLNIDECYQGNVKNNKTLPRFNGDIAAEKSLASWMREGITKKYLNLWVNGMSVDWNILYEGEKPNKVALPTYPFSKERYWVAPKISGKTKVRAGERDEPFIIHPLVQANKSDLFFQSYYSVFDGSEYFFTRNESSQVSTMTDLALLEMARIAIVLSLGDRYEQINIGLYNTRWFASVVVENEPVKLHIDLHDMVFTEDNHLDSVSYTIYSMQNNFSEKITHLQGTGLLKSLVSPQNINITALMENTGGPIFDASRCDELYGLLNLDCVPSDLGIQKFFPGDGQAVIQHCLPDDLSVDNSEYVLHPTPMTLACKTAAAIVKGISNVAENESKKDGREKKLHDDLFLMAGSHSISVEKIEILMPLCGTLYTWIRYAQSGSSCGSTFKMDISLCDEQGNVCVKITGYEIGIYLSDDCKSSDHDDSNNIKKLLLAEIAGEKQPGAFENAWTQSDMSPIKYGGTYFIVCGCERTGKMLVEYLVRSGALNLVLVMHSSSICSFKSRLKEIKGLSADIQYITVDSMQSFTLENIPVDMKSLMDKINGIFYTGKAAAYSLSAETIFNSIYPNSIFSYESLDFLCNLLSGESMVGRQFPGNNDGRDVYRVAQVNDLDGLQEKGITCGKSIIIDWMEEDTDKSSQTIQEKDKSLYSDIDFLEKVFAQAFMQDNKYAFTIIDKGQAPHNQRFLYKLPTDDGQQLNNKEIIDENTLSIEELEKNIRNDLKKIIHEQLKINLELLDVDTGFSDFGYDSILLTEFSHRLSQYFGMEIPPAVLFGHYTLEKLTDYLLSDANEAIIQHYTKSQNNVNSSKSRNIPKTPGVSGRQSCLIKNSLIKNNESAVKPSEGSEEYTTGISYSERVAVIGMSGKLPMADDLDAFWNNLTSGKDCISEIPADRSGLKEDIIATQQGEAHVTWGGFIDGIAEFDPEFFGISDHEAELMDPNQRLIMMYVYRAIEDAGYSPKSLSGKNIAVFIGTANSGYDRLIEKSGSKIEAFTATGTQPSVGPNRISYYLDLCGPSEPIETACASSLVAIRRGIAALNDGCEMAIVGGVNTLLTPTGHIAYEKAGMLSEDGRCKTFSTNADGFVRSEGAGILILKKLGNAEKAGDPVYGLICGSAENHGGRAHSLTTPNPIAQTQLLEKAYQEANIDPRTVTYLEAHGTGTQLGDSIEIDALKTAFKSLITRSQQEPGTNDINASLAVEGYCGLGSVKTNIGHTELASGVVGVIKVLLQLKHKMLVKNLNTNPLNPYLQLNESPFFVIQNAQKWQALSDGSGKPIPRRAGVSSFGMGGVNAHVILEEYVSRQEKVSDTGSAQLVVFSAKNKKQLEAVVQQMLDYVLAHEKLSLDSFAYTLQVGRDQLDVRLAMIVSDREALITGIKHFLNMSDATRTPVPLSYSGEGKNETPDHHFIHELIQDRNFAEIGQCWVLGGKIPWDSLYKGKVINRISLPTYPFDNKPYWVSRPGESAQKVMETPDINHALPAGKKLKNVRKMSGSPLFESWFLHG
ncbi:MAG: polyketide synthase dehydratase domain-containing protein [Gammaproteobacteria bacterium]|nr:polyketide synthase dehydratase domain-containing protein [Gammaproteobacteria bacterium]